MFSNKNGFKVKVRRGLEEDAEAILNIQLEIINEEHYLIIAPSEFHKTAEEQREWMKKILKNERETIIVAECNEQVVGWLAFQSQERKRMSHVGTFAIMISKNYRGIGIGRMLIEALIEWAEENPFIEKISLGVFSTNFRAINLYKNMGFIIEGRKIKQFKIDNHYVDDILMYRFV